MQDTEYDSYFEKIFKNHTKGMEEHTFVHYNSSLGMQIYGKEHYKAEMKKRRLVPYAETERLAEQYDKTHPHKDYGEISPRAMDIIRSLKMTADKHGNIKLDDRAINGLISVGAISPQSKHIPTDMNGGFS